MAEAHRAVRESDGIGLPATAYLNGVLLAERRLVLASRQRQVALHAFTNGRSLAEVIWLAPEEV